MYLPEKEGFRESLGVPCVEAVKVGVLLPSGGDELVEEPPDRTRLISGARFALSMADSEFEFGIGIGSDISNIVRRGVVAEDTPKETLRNTLPPLVTKPSAMIARWNVQ